MRDDYRLTQAQIDQLGNELVGTAGDPGIVAVDEQHFGPIGDANGAAAGGDELVVLVYNITDQSYYDCAQDTYTAGYFAQDFIAEDGMNTIVIDAFDWANRVGDQSANPEGVSHLYEGVIAHELEHLLMSYSDPGELSWVDEGLADFAIFLNGYESGGSHVAYHQVFHRETSLTRWAGGLENYGASYTFFQYLWEQAGGNGPDDGAAQYVPDQEYDAEAGDLLIKLIFENELDSIEGVSAALAEWEAATGGDLPTFNELFQNWAIAVYLDDETSAIYDIKALDLGTDRDSWGYTIDIANEQLFDARGVYQGRTPEARINHSHLNVPDPTALPYGVSYETWRNPGPTFRVDFSGTPTSEVAPHSAPTHWFGGSMSQADTTITFPVSGGEELTFWTWYFIEEGWDYGFVEAEVNGEWVTIPLVDPATGTEVTTDENPHDNNEEGNGLTGVSGGDYSAGDAPVYIQLQGTVPDGATALRFRYSTDEAYLDTGWFIDDVALNGALVDLASSTVDGWIETEGIQNNVWSLQLLASCDLTPGVDSPGELVDEASGTYVYRFTDQSEVHVAGFDTRCASGNQRDVVAIVSNLPTGDLVVLDADYTLRVTGESRGPGWGRPGRG